MIARARKAIRGLKTLTTSHILRSVLGNTPGACSSTKFAELSNPDMPSMAAENPKNKASIIPPLTGTAELKFNVSRPLENIYRAHAPTKTVRAVKCVIKITMATFDDSPIPMIVKIIKIARSVIVAITTGRPIQRA